MDTTHKIICGDNLPVLREMEDKSVDLIVCSPPYGPQRPYGALKFDLRGEDWLSWAIERYIECLRVSRGLVVWVVNGYTESKGERKGQYVPLPAMLEYALYCRTSKKTYPAGMKFRLWKSACYSRFGIFGSGGKQKLRDDWESCVCATAAPDGVLPWSDNTACGKPPKFPPGGKPSYRLKSGERVKKDGPYNPPARCNPGNVIHGPVGGGHMGHPLAHKSEAPFPLWLAEFFVLSYCPPGGTVLDIFGGSGTTQHAAAGHGRNSIAIEAQESQCAVAKARLSDIGSNASVRYHATAVIAEAA